MNHREIAASGGVRLDRFVAEYLGRSRARAQALIAGGLRKTA